MTAKEKSQNRLAQEKSPYLLQHADNPVDWYPWGEEAFQKARREDKPIFLSIGYSTCHWCHVMEEESFENEDIAGILNQHFVSIKVDREERPDIDQMYMTAAVAMRGQGGWPLNVFLSPDKKPFFAGTYFPPYPKWGSPGLMDILNSISETWRNDRSQMMEAGSRMVEILEEKTKKEIARQGLTEDILKTAYDQLSQMHDPAFGGFGSAPKFPSGHTLSFLLRAGRRRPGAEALEMVERTLQQMAQGGISDHLGGGFHRYATDRQWRIPHFEKMLYDQALLAVVYTEAYQITQKESYGRIARETLDYVLRDMQQSQGGFYSAEDADSLDPDEYAPGDGSVAGHGRKKEGAFYLWRYEEIDRLLGREDAEIFRHYFGMKPEGNAEADPHGEFQGKNILYIAKSLEETADFFKKDAVSTARILERLKAKLFEARCRRPRPFLDDKILTDWNGLMIAGLALGSRVFKEPRYEEAARKAADFIMKEMVDEKGRLRHRWRDGEAAVPGTLDDYAFLIHGLLNLYEADFEIRYFKEAHRLAEAMVELFWDEVNGGFYFTAEDTEVLLFRQKPVYDAVLPSGNAVAALDLARLFHMTGNKFFEKKADEIFLSFAQEIRSGPAAYTQMLTAVDFVLGPAREIVIAGDEEDPQTAEMIDAVYGRFIPRRVIILHPAKDEDVISAMPFVKDQIPLKGKPTVYVCENRVCKLPVQEIGSLEKILEGLR